MTDQQLDKLFDFYSVIAKTWTPDETEGWTDYAERVELGAVERPSLSSIPVDDRPWIERWKEAGRPVDRDSPKGGYPEAC